MSTVLCSVSGLDDKNCKTKVKDALNSLKGVQKVGVNLTTGTVEIDYNEPATENKIRNCIEDAGYKIEYK